MFYILLWLSLFSETVDKPRPVAKHLDLQFVCQIAPQWQSNAVDVILETTKVRGFIFLFSECRTKV